MAAATWDDLPTPCLILDEGVLDRNLSRMRDRARAQGVKLRPHLKTAKCAEVARRACGGITGPIAVSTLREAEHLFEKGFKDLLLAVGMAPQRLARAAALVRQGASLALVLDGVEVARAASACARSAGVKLRFLVEVDSGGHRGGIPPSSPRLLEVARAVHELSGLELGGVVTHAGQAYHCRSLAQVREVARQERDGVAAAAAALRSAGLPCPVVSAGSTPTAVHAEDWQGIGEIRPGVYMFNDLFQLALGSCLREDLALSVLATVIGHHPETGHLVLDAGALALSKDASARALRPELGYGEVCDPDTLLPLGFHVEDTTQEHGLVPVRAFPDFERLPVGARVRVLPSHACLTAAAYDRYHVVNDGEPAGTWERVNGW